MGRQATEILAPRKRGAGHILDYYGPLSLGFKVAAGAESFLFFGPFLLGAVLTELLFQWTVDVDGACDISASRMGVEPTSVSDVQNGRTLLVPPNGTGTPEIAFSIVAGDMWTFSIPVLKRVTSGFEFVGVSFGSSTSATSGTVSLT